MKRCVFLLMLVSAIILVSCSKDENREQITSFNGTVFYQGMSNEPFTNGQIKIIGSELGSYGDYMRSFPIRLDGTFEIKVTTSNIHNFQISVEADDGGTAYQSCEGTGMTSYCTLMEPNMDYRDIKVYVFIPSN